MRSFRLTVAYDGSRLAGWQRQPNGPTVQAALEDALRPLLGEAVSVVGSGRTDAGVHALGQVASFVTNSPRSAQTIAQALRASLPEDIRLLDCEETAAPFHALRDARGKHYRYLLDDGPVADLFLRPYVWRQRRPLDFDSMREAASHLIGEHDFASFQSAGSPRKTTVRHVRQLTVGLVPPGGPFAPSDWIPTSARLIDATHNAGQGRAVADEAPDPIGRASPHRLLAIDIAANGFLYNMVRNIVGTLVEVGRGVRPPRWVASTRDARDRTVAGPTAPAQGLFLVAVAYDPLPTAT